MLGEDLLRLIEQYGGLARALMGFRRIGPAPVEGII